VWHKILVEGPDLGGGGCGRAGMERWGGRATFMIERTWELL
jgi:hypothetical protein